MLPFLRHYRCVVLAMAFLLVGVCACDDETDDPFKGDGLDLDWPSQDPDRYHWDGLTDPYFELWNWHIFAPELDEGLSFSMGVANPGSDDPESRGGFVHISGGGISTPVIDLYSVRDFDASRQIGDVTVGDVRGTQTALHGSIGGDEPAEFDLTLTVDEGWEKTLGLLTNIPGFPTNWHVNALAATASGHISLGDRDIELNDAPMIEDHFWGTTFPGVSYRVMANSFDEPDTSLVFFGGDLLLGPFELPIIMLAVRNGDTVYELRSQDLDVGGQITTDDNGHYRIQATKGNIRIAVNIVNLIADPSRGLAFDSHGVGFGGWIWHTARLDVEVSRYEDGPGWLTEFEATSDRVFFGLGEPSLYSDY